MTFAINRLRNIITQLPDEEYKDMDKNPFIPLVQFVSIRVILKNGSN